MSSISVNEMADAINAELDKYRDIAIDCIKEAAEEAGKTVQKQITATSPVRTGKYAKSWKTKITKESPVAVEVTVYSPTQYRIAHLLEHGHAKRGGGRTSARVHIQPAEQEGIKQFEKDVKRGLQNG